MILLKRNSMGAGLAALLMGAASIPLVAAQSPPAPFNNQCRTCHSVKQGDHRLGPSLHKIYGAKAGSSPGYANYSQGLKSAGVTWDDATLDKFIENPEQVVPNNNMKPYKGIDDPAVRKQIVDFLKSQSIDAPVDSEPAPNVAAIQPHQSATTRVSEGAHHPFFMRRTAQ